MEEIKYKAADIAMEIYKERCRQITVGYDEGHDDEHKEGQISRAAAVYAYGNDMRDIDTEIAVWPWSSDPKTRTRREELVISGALILAEIARLDRLTR